MKTKKIMQRMPKSLLTGMLLFSAFECSAVLISDDTFANSDWSTSVVASTGAVAQTASQKSVGGNPTDFRNMTHDFSSPGSLIVFHKYSGATYNPSASGAITSLEYSEDHIQFNPPFVGAAIGGAAALMQGGFVYAASTFAFTNTGTWSTTSFAALTEASFTNSTPATPDFSVTGGEISFGFIRFNSVGDPSTFLEHGLDNWSFDLTTTPIVVPLPAAFWLFGCSLLGLFGVKKRKHLAV